MLAKGPEVIGKTGRIVNRRTMLGAIGGGAAAALGDRRWPRVGESRAQRTKLRRKEPLRPRRHGSPCRRTDHWTARFLKVGFAGARHQ